MLQNAALMSREAGAAACHEIGSLKWRIRTWEEGSAPWLFTDEIRNARARIKHLQEQLATLKIGGAQ